MNIFMSIFVEIRYIDPDLNTEKNENKKILRSGSWSLVGYSIFKTIFHITHKLFLPIYLLLLIIVIIFNEQELKLSYNKFELVFFLQN